MLNKEELLKKAETEGNIFYKNTYIELVERANRDNVDIDNNLINKLINEHEVLSERLKDNPYSYKKHRKISEFLKTLLEE